MGKLEGGSPGEWFGSSVSGAGDVDGDGRAEVVVGAIHDDPGGRNSAGSASVYGFKDGAFRLLGKLEGDSAGAWFGSSVSSAGDLDGDGRAEVVVGAYLDDPGGRNDAGSAPVYSFKDGAFRLLGKLEGDSAEDRFGRWVSSAGDIDGDGHPELVIGAFRDDPGGREDAGSAFVYGFEDGAFTLLGTLEGDSAGERFGRSVTSGGDLDGDGLAEVVVGAYLDDPGGREDAGSVYVYSYKNGAFTPLGKLEGDSAGDQFGRSVSSAGDLDGDGRAEVLVGAHLHDPGGREDAGSAYAYSYKNGSFALLGKLEGDSEQDQLGISVSSAGDLDGDGLAEVVVGAYQDDPGGRDAAGSASIYSYRQGAFTLLGKIEGDSERDIFGYSVSHAGDLDGDGRAEVLVGALWDDPGGREDAGSVYVYAFRPPEICANGIDDDEDTLADCDDPDCLSLCWPGACPEVKLGPLGAATCETLTFELRAADGAVLSERTVAAEGRDGLEIAAELCRAFGPADGGPDPPADDGFSASATAYGCRFCRDDQTPFEIHILHEDEGGAQDVRVITGRAYVACGLRIAGCLHTEEDTDRDGWCDRADNCPAVKNPAQADGDGDGLGDACDGEADLFVRGDLTGDGDYELTDAVRILIALFRDPLLTLRSGFSCDDALDVDGNGNVNLTDGVLLLIFLFRGGAEPGAPFRECGPDPDPDDPLACEAHPACR